jgi:hypothetical protein
MLADDHPYAGSDPVHPPAVDAVHGLVQEDVGTLLFHLRGQNAASLVVLAAPGADQRPQPPDDRPVSLLPQTIKEPANEACVRRF